MKIKWRLAVKWPMTWLPRKRVFLYTYTSRNWEKCIYWGRKQKNSNGWLNKQCLEYFLAISSHHIACNNWNICILYELQLPVAFVVSWKYVWNMTLNHRKSELWLYSEDIMHFHPTEFSENATYRATLSVSSTTTGFIWLCVSTTSVGTASLLTENIAVDSSS